MVLEQFLVMLGADTETEKVKSFGAALTKVGSIATVVVGALKTVTLAAWAFADSYVRKAEELYKSNSGLVSVTKEQVEMSKKYQDGMKKLGDNIESVKARIAFGFLPTMLKMVDSLNAFLAANKDLIVNGITRLLNIISYASQVINNTVRFIAKAIEATIGWKAALLILAGVFAFVKRAMILAFITNPITWVVAAILGLMLLIDDFMTYLDGGESQFGDFWGAMLEWIEEVKPALQEVWDALVLGMSYLIEFGVFVAQYFGGALVDAVQVIVAALTMLYALFTGNTELMAAAWDGLVENMISMFQNFASLFEPLAQMLVTIMSAVWDSIVNAIIERVNIVKAGIVKSFNEMISLINQASSNIISAVTSPFVEAFNTISSIFNNAVEFISSLWAAMVGRISTAFGDFVVFFSSIIRTLIAVVSTAWDSIVGAIIERINIVKAVLSGLRENVVSVFAGMRDFILSIIMSIASGFNTVVSTVIAVVSAIIAAFFNGLSVVSGAFTAVVDSVVAMWAAMVDSISTAFSAFVAFFSSIISTLVAVVSTTWDSIVNAVQTRISLMVGAITGFVSTLGGILSGVFDVVTAPFARAFDWISNKFSSLGGLISGAVSGIGKMSGMGASSAANSTVNNGGSMTVNAPISVTTSDPNKAAKLVKSGVTDTMNAAHRNMGSKVVA